MPPALEELLVPMIEPAGACIFFHGTLMHRGGANRSASPRLAFSNQYCQPWARTQENFYLGIPPALVRGISPRLQALLGHEIVAPFMRHVTARKRQRFCSWAMSTRSWRAAPLLKSPGAGDLSPIEQDL
jgi:ectoine hydroxylase-related dioxygenase (phytanoyl-CoA dioxygenase family)